MNNSNLINKRVEWEFKCDPKHTGGLAMSGTGLVHAIGYEAAEDSWQDFVILVELENGELVSIPQGASNMCVCKECPTT